jgi:hypothetical protein
MSDRTIQSAGSTDEPAGGLGETALLTGATAGPKSDGILIRRAALARWPVSAKLKAKLAAKLEDCLDREEDGRIVASLGKVLTAMEGQNQADDHLADKNSRLDNGKATERVDHAVIVTGIDPEAL